MKPVKTLKGAARQSFHQRGSTRKLPIWEEKKKEKKRGRIIRLVFLLVFLVIIINVALRLPGLYRNFSHPFDRFPAEQEKWVALDTSFRTNLLLASYDKTNGLNDLAIVSYEPVDRRLTVLFFNFPENRKLQFTANHVFEKEGIVGLQRFISPQVAVPLDRYLAFESSDLTFTTDNVSGYYNEIKSTPFLFKSISYKQSLNKILKTNLTSSEIWTLIWKVRGAKFEEKDGIYLDKIGSADLSDKETQQALGSLFIDRRISDEAAAVTIRNSSGETGLGTATANYLSNLGATVIAVEAGEEPSPENFLIVRKEKPLLEKRLSSIITFKKKKAHQEDFSGDFLLIVGEEATKMLTLP